MPLAVACVRRSRRSIYSFNPSHPLHPTAIESPPSTPVKRPPPRPRGCPTSQALQSVRSPACSASAGSAGEVDGKVGLCPIFVLHGKTLFLSCTAAWWTASLFDLQLHSEILRIPRFLLWFSGSARIKGPNFIWMSTLQQAGPMHQPPNCPVSPSSLEGVKGRHSHHLHK